MIDVMGWGRGDSAMTLIGKRYQRRYGEILGEVEKSHACTLEQHSALTYIKGVSDVCAMYRLFVDNADADVTKAKILEIDSTIEDLLSGKAFEATETATTADTPDQASDEAAVTCDWCGKQATHLERVRHGETQMWVCPECLQEATDSARQHGATDGGVR